MICDEYTARERLLEVSLLLSVLCNIALLALVAFNVIHWLAWVPGLIASIGVTISNAMQLNRIDELRGDRDEEDYGF